jgi:hypothetical protein
MDPNYVEYDPTAQVHDPAMCQTLDVKPRSVSDIVVKSGPGGLEVVIPVSGNHVITVYNSLGALVHKQIIDGPGRHRVTGLKKPGRYLVKVSTAGRVRWHKAVVYSGKQ